MNIILLSGGSGRRLWPLSNDVRSKQFIKLLKNDDGDYESMLQRVYRQIKRADESSEITIATGKTQVSSTVNQLGDSVDVCVEPARRDTFPAILLATLYLRDIKGKKDDETVVVCPVDPYTDDSFFDALKELGELAEDPDYRISLLGGVPTYPSAKYGYIIPANEERISGVKKFCEKPDEKTAQTYIDEGGLWNLGVFAFRIGEIAKLSGGMDYDEYLTHYEEQKAISFDYAVCEHEEKMQVLRYKGEWKDIGTWNTFSEIMPEDTVGEALLDESCDGVVAVNQLDIPVLAMGLKDVVIAASPDGILISDKNRSSHMKEYVDRLDAEVMYAEKSWGSYHVIDTTSESLTIKVTLEPGSSMNYHSHEFRDEVWVIAQGSGFITVDGMQQEVKQGDVVTVMAGCKHTVAAETHMVIIEVQLGRDIDVRDKIKHEL